MPESLRILLAGVPFGCDNVGDEAILECAVNIFREVAPDCALTVATNDGPNTARKLSVAHAPLIGFEEGGHFAYAASVIAACDVFVWCGATGLSDYPEIPLELLRIAHEQGKTTIVWGVGMNDELNPAKYTVLPGRRRRLLKSLSVLTANLVDFVRVEETRRVRRAKTKIAQGLNAASLVVVRDPESRAEVLQCGVTREVIVGADSALILEPAPFDTINMPEEAHALLNAPGKKVGVCISAQRKVANADALLEYLNRLVEEDEARVLFVPMNPITDAALMAELRAKMRYPERSAVLSGRYEPADILTVASRLDVLVSSRLHLLILASIVHAPIIGISRGSKLDNFLGPFGLRTVGSVEALNTEAVLSETRRLLNGRAGFEATSQGVRKDLMTRLDIAKAALKQTLSARR